MSFLAPWALGLAALAALPLVLHLFQRDTRRRLAFPAIRYLRRARDRSARAVKPRCLNIETRKRALSPKENPKSDDPTF